MRIKKERKIVNHDKEIAIIRTVIFSVISAALGFSLGWFFEGKVILSIIVFSILAVFCLAGWIFTIVWEKNDSLIKTLKDDLKKGRYIEIIRIGLPLSRPLHIADNSELRYQILDLVVKALEALRDKGETEVRVEDQTKDINVFIVDTKIDGCGWSYFASNPLKNVDQARHIVKEGIKEAIIVLNSDQTHKEEIFKSISTGITHMLGFVTNSLEKDDDSFGVKHDKNTIAKINRYYRDLKLYGDFVRYVFGLETECSEEEVIDNLVKLIPGVNHTTDYFKEIREYNAAILNNDPKIKYKKICNPLCRYYFGLYELSLYLGPNIEKHSFNYLNKAKENAEMMVVGFSKDDEELDVFKGTMFEKDVEKYVEEFEGRHKPDLERMVKAMLMLGLIGVGFKELNEAKKIMEETSHRAKEIDRCETYSRAQRHLISINEKVFISNVKNNYYENKEILLDDLDSLSKEMDEIRKETFERLNSIDRKMNDSYKKRKAKYKRMRQEVARKGAISWQKY